MKVLFLDHQEADFGAATLFLGLHQALGADNVIEYPYKPSYHGQVHEYRSDYQHANGSAEWHSSRKMPDGSIMGTTAPFAWMPALPGRAWGKDDVVRMLCHNEIGLVIIASPRKNSVGAFRDLLSAVGRAKMPPIAFVDGEDYTDLRADLVSEIEPRVYFKRELLRGTPRNLYSARVEPFPFSSVVPERAPPKVKNIDVLFVGGGTWPGRTDACNALRNAFGSSFVGGVNVHFSFDEYLDAIARSRIAVSVRGFGHDTLRFWEIPSMPQTLLVCDRLAIDKPYEFTDGVNCKTFGSTDQLVQVCQHALANEEWRVQVASAGNAHLRQYHTAEARARQLLAITVGHYP